MLYKFNLVDDIIDSIIYYLKSYNLITNQIINPIMLSRSFNSLQRTVFYMSKQKNITQQYKKPLQKLKQEDQENKPQAMSPREHQKKAKQILKRQISKHQSKGGAGMFGKNSDRKNKQMQKRQKREQMGKNQVEYFNKNKQQQASAIHILKQSSKDWLQFDKNSDLLKEQTQQIQRISAIINKNSKDFHNKQLKEYLISVDKSKGIKSLDRSFLILMRLNLLKAYTIIQQRLQFRAKEKQKTIQNSADKKQHEINVSHQTISNLLSFLATNNEHTQIQQTLNVIQEIGEKIDHSCDEFLKILFFDECHRQNHRYLMGEQGLLFGAENKLFVDKLQIARKVLQNINLEKKSNQPKLSQLPQWFKVSKEIVYKYKFAQNQFEELVIDILNDHKNLIPDWFYDTQDYLDLISRMTFGKQNRLNYFIECIKPSLKNKPSQLYRSLTNYLMNYKIQANMKSAFQVTQTMVQLYKQAFESNNKALATVICILAADSGYIDFSQHFLKFHVQGFKDQTLESQESKIVEETIINNFNVKYQTKQQERKLNHQNNQKLLIKLTKNGKNDLIKIKAAIKLGQLTKAFKIFQESVLKKNAIERQKKNIQYVLRNKSTVTYHHYAPLKQINEFMSNLSDEYYWSLYKRSQDMSQMLKDYIPQQKYSFWEETQRKLKYEDLIKSQSTGQLQKMQQPKSDIEAGEQSLKQYLETQFLERKKQEQQIYEHQKQIIRFRLKVQGIYDLNVIHNDKILSEKYQKYQSQLSESSLQLLENFGLKDYDIQAYGWEQFEERFNNMRIYANIPKDKHLDFSQYKKVIERKKNFCNKGVIQQILLKAPQTFRQADLLVKLKQQPNVQKLILWGICQNEPMAIYLGEKLAMQTGQTISHRLAAEVSHMLSYKRVLFQEFIQRCKQCLRIVGKIDRELIYDFEKDYDHILIRKRFRNYMLDLREKKYDDAIDTMISVKPKLDSMLNDPKFYQDSIKRRALEAMI